MSLLGALHKTPITGTKHTGTVIFFHGSGGTGESMKEWVKLLVRKPFQFPHLRVLYPTAPLQPYTPMGGAMSNVWFDRLYIAKDALEHNESLQNISVEVKTLIQHENEMGIPTNRIIVGGFSMGGALSFHTAYRWEKSVAGIFAFSSFLNENSLVFKELEQSKGKNVPPLLQLHGDSDDLVYKDWGRDTFDELKSLGVQGEFHCLEKLGHSLNMKGLEIIRKWVEERLPDNVE